MEQFIMNNCKIANELRKYRDLTGCVNRAGLSDDPENYVEYVITRELSYMDMVTANAVYSLWRSGEGDNGFRAETIGQIMAGDMARRLRPEKQDEIEERLQKLAGTELYIIPGKDRTGDHLQRPGGGGIRLGRPHRSRFSSPSCKDSSLRGKVGQCGLPPEEERCPRKQRGTRSLFGRGVTGKFSHVAH